MPPKRLNKQRVPVESGDQVFWPQRQEQIVVDRSNVWELDCVEIFTGLLLDLRDQCFVLTRRGEIIVERFEVSGSRVAPDSLDNGTKANNIDKVSHQGKKTMVLIAVRTSGSARAGSYDDDMRIRIITGADSRKSRHESQSSDKCELRTSRLLSRVLTDPGRAIAVRTRCFSRTAFRTPTVRHSEDPTRLDVAVVAGAGMTAQQRSLRRS